jgi:hypothetical protein
MSTAQQILTLAAKSIGYLGRTETLSAQDATDGLTVLNNLLDSWAGEILMSYANQSITHALVAGTNSYTIGSGGDIDTTRPDNILQAWIRDTNSGNLDYPMTIINQYNWNRIGDKSIQSQIPTTLFYDSQHPLGTLNLFPGPNTAGYELRLNAIIQQTSFSTLTHSLTAPPGYERAYILNAGTELINAGFPTTLSDRDYAQLINNASNAKANLKRKNIKEVVADYDNVIVAQSDATYNVFSDGWPR